MRHRVDNNEDGFDMILALFAKKKIDFKQIGVAIESPHEPIVDFLLAHGIAVYPVNPNAIGQYRKSLKVSGSKSDTADAQLIADYLRQHHQTLRGWQTAEPALRQLQLLTEDREKFVKEKVRLQNQLRSTLRGYFPQAIEAFSSLTTPAALAFLRQFPSPAAIQQNTEADWLDFLSEHRVFHQQARRRFLSALFHPSIPVDEAEAWQKADDLTVDVYQTTCSFPPDQRYSLTNQMQRAAVSVAANIAEGSDSKMIRQADSGALLPWLGDVAESSIPALKNFAKGIKADLDAVTNALKLPWSQGQTEGQVNRLKLIKRQMVRRVTRYSIAPVGSLD